LALLALSENYLRNTSTERRQSIAAKNTSTLAAALPLASLLFMLANLLADSSTLIAWSWTGYENGSPRGPLPHLHGHLTLAAQALGLLLGSRFVSSAVRFLYGATSAFVLYQYRNWLGYFGGLGLTMFLMSIIPLVFQRAANTHHPILTYSVAMLIYCLFQVSGVFTVAYAFVPGGEYFRERTDVYVLYNLDEPLVLIFLFVAFSSCSSSVYYLPSGCVISAISMSGMSCRAGPGHMAGGPWH
jgi:hypothetical protein